jgi:molecular chaperone DnaK (HSP70)
MPYILGVDLGTGATTAAVSRLRGGGWGEVEIVGATGAADRGVPGLLGRVGDHVPLVLDDAPYPAAALAAELAAWVVDQVVAEEGEPAGQVAFVVPVSWGPYRRGLVHEALWRLGLDGVLLLAEPVAAAEAYAAGHPVDVGAALAVYSLGETACGCSVVRRTSPTAFEVLDSTELAEGAGAADLDDVLVDRVQRRLGREAVPEPLLGDLRRRCRTALAELATATEVPVDGRATLTRDDVDELVRPVLAATAGALARTVRAAGVAPDDLAGVLLTGEATRLPPARELVEAAIPARVLAQVEPILGAVHAARTRLARPDEVAPYRTPTAEHPAVPDEPGDPGDEVGPRPPRPPVVVTPLESPRSRAARRGAGR